MHYYEVAPNQIVRLDQNVFTYSFKDSLAVGHIVVVEVGKKQMVGVIIRSVERPSYSTKNILSLIDSNPLPSELIKLSQWLSVYYNSHLALVLQTILPSGIRKSRRLKTVNSSLTKRDRTNIVFNKEQVSAISTIDSSLPGTFLLQGITGSGKTEVYIELAKRAYKAGKSVIVLVPEISLTSQMLAEFSNHFNDILIVHSTMTESARHRTWQEAQNSTSPRLVIGARSALFTPLRHLGLIIIDESHEPSFKQEQSPRYSALRAATMLGRFHRAKVVLGSATPSITDRYLAEKSDRPIQKLTKLARKNAINPTVTLVDMTNKSNLVSGQRFLSRQLLDATELTLSQGKQVLLFHNRRGSATTTLCENCGWAALCPVCYVPLTLHSDQHQLRCHICNHHEGVPTSCPVCSHVDIIHKGVGTKLIETELSKLYPKATIARFDADNVTSQTLNERYSELYNGKIDIAIGTQIVAKGLDLPHLRTVGVIQADSGLALPDFSSSERTFQLLTQVIGRVGRNEHETRVIVQSYQPTHPSVTYGLSQDYESFYNYALAERKKALFPPFSYLLKLVCTYKSESAAIKAAQSLAGDLREKLNKSVNVLGPTPAFYEHWHNSYRWQLTLKSPKREYLIDALGFVPPNHWQSELDPTSLL